MYRTIKEEYVMFHKGDIVMATCDCHEGHIGEIIFCAQSGKHYNIQLSEEEVIRFVKEDFVYLDQL